MTNEGHVAKPPSPRRLLWLTFGALGAGSLLVLCFVLPAELGIDVLGFGRASGVSKLAPVKEVQVAAPAGTASVARASTVPFRTDVIEIPLGSGDNPVGSELEYKVRLKAGETLVYSWEVVGAPPTDEFYYDFHGQSDPSPDVKVTSYVAELGTKGSGTLVAPFDGIHGWYFQNQSVNLVKVRLRLAGFYGLVSAKEIEDAEAAAPPAFGPPK